MSFCHHIPGVKCPNCEFTYTKEEMVQPDLEKIMLRKEVEQLKIKLDIVLRASYALTVYREGTTNYEKALSEIAGVKNG